MIEWLRKNIYIYFEEIENLDEEVELSVVIPRVYKSLQIVFAAQEDEEFLKKIQSQNLPEKLSKPEFIDHATKWAVYFKQSLDEKFRQNSKLAIIEAFQKHSQELHDKIGDPIINIAE